LEFQDLVSLFSEPGWKRIVGRAKQWSVNLKAGALADILHHDNISAAEKARSAVEIDKFFDEISERKIKLNTKKGER